MGYEVCLSHPKQTKAIAHARLKSDKVDVVMLARLLKANFCRRCGFQEKKSAMRVSFSPIECGW